MWHIIVGHDGVASSEVRIHYATKYSSNKRIAMFIVYRQIQTVNWEIEPEKGAFNPYIHDSVLIWRIRFWAPHSPHLPGANEIENSTAILDHAKIFLHQSSTNVMGLNEPSPSFRGPINIREISTVHMRPKSGVRCNTTKIAKCKENSPHTSCTTHINIPWST